MDFTPVIQGFGVVEEHSHPHEQLGYMLEGEADFSIGGQTQTVRAGEMWRSARYTSKGAAESGTSKRCEGTTCTQSPA